MSEREHAEMVEKVQNMENLKAAAAQQRSVRVTVERWRRRLGLNRGVDGGSVGTLSLTDAHRSSGR